MLDMVVKEITDAVKESVQSGIKEISDKFDARLKALEDRPLPEKGESVTIDDLRPMVEEFVKAIEIPSPKDGEPGKSVTVEDVAPLIHKALEDAVFSVKEEIKNIPAPKDWKDAEVDYGRIKTMVDEILKEAVSKIDIPIPKDGEPGKDALDIEILPEIEQEKSYQRGTFATHKGGLWRAYERTKGMRGWECIVDGIAEIDVEYDGQRKALIKIEHSSGLPVEKELHIPAILGKGVWREGKYERGDSVQLSGSTWLAIEDTEERPGEGSKGWIMAAKQGGTGKSAYDIARQAGFTGTKEEWLQSLGMKTVVKI